LLSLCFYHVPLLYSQFSVRLFCQQIRNEAINYYFLLLKFLYNLKYICQLYRT
jgi:hypothetical protein